MEECDVAKEYLESDRANAIDETTVGACTHLEVLITVIDANSFSVFYKSLIYFLIHMICWPFSGQQSPK